jgi:hypothetical protein
MRAITGSKYSVVNDFFWNSFQIIGPSKPGEKIDNSSSNIHAITTKFSRLVVPWKNVMIVVPTFSGSKKSNKSIFSRIYIPEE